MKKPSKQISHLINELNLNQSLLSVPKEDVQIFIETSYTRNLVRIVQIIPTCMRTSLSKQLRHVPVIHFSYLKLSLLLSVYISGYFPHNLFFFLHLKRLQVLRTC